MNNLALASNAAAGSLLNPGLLNPSLLTGTVCRDDRPVHGVSFGLKMAF